MQLSAWVSPSINPRKWSAHFFFVTVYILPYIRHLKNNFMHNISISTLRKRPISLACNNFKAKYITFSEFETCKFRVNNSKRFLVVIFDRIIEYCLLIPTFFRWKRGLWIFVFSSLESAVILSTTLKFSKSRQF